MKVFFFLTMKITGFLLNRKPENIWDVEPKIGVYGPPKWIVKIMKTLFLNG